VTNLQVPLPKPSMAVSLFFTNIHFIIAYTSLDWQLENYLISKSELADVNLTVLR
jgi:hypothetical protein